MANPLDSARFKAKLISCGATPHGADYVTMMVDPFHDFKLDVVGLPDSHGGKSVVFDVRKQVSITKDPTLPAGKWDCNIAVMPAVLNAPLIAGEMLADGLRPRSIFRDSSATKVIEPGLVQAWQAPSGTGTFDWNVVGNHGSNSVTFEEFFRGDAECRIVGGAFEVHNTTESLHKGGSVTCYSFDNNRQREHFLLCQDSTATNLAERTAVTKRTPPNSISNAKLLGGVSWGAEDGCLVPFRIDPSRNPPQANRVGHTVYLTDPDPAVSDDYQDLDAFADVQLTAAINSAGASHTFDNPAMTSGAYFTGLSEETSLLLDVRIFVEVFPYPGSSLNALAKSAPSYDAKAMQCAMEIMANLQPGYPVSWNGAGDFFRAALRTVDKVLRTSNKIAHGLENVPVLGPMVKEVTQFTDPAMAALLAGKKGKASAKKLSKAAQKDLTEHAVGFRRL